MIIMKLYANADLKWRSYFRYKNVRMKNEKIIAFKKGKGKKKN